MQPDDYLTTNTFFSRKLFLRHEIMRCKRLRWEKALVYLTFTILKDSVLTVVIVGTYPESCIARGARLGCTYCMSKRILRLNHGGIRGRAGNVGMRGCGTRNYLLCSRGAACSTEKHKPFIGKRRRKCLLDFVSWDDDDDEGGPLYRSLVRGNEPLFFVQFGHFPFSS